MKRKKFWENIRSLRQKYNEKLRIYGYPTKEAEKLDKKIIKSLDGYLKEIDPYSREDVELIGEVLIHNGAFTNGDLLRKAEEAQAERYRFKSYTEDRRELIFELYKVSSKKISNILKKLIPSISHGT